MSIAFKIQAWGKLGEVCQQYLVKGRLIFAEGCLHRDRWTDDKGETQYRTYVIARQMQMLDRKPGEQEVVAEGEAEEPVAAYSGSRTLTRSEYRFTIRPLDSDQSAI